MLKDKGSAYDGFAALYDGTGNSNTTVFETVATKCVLEYELVQKVQDAGLAPLNGAAIGSISSLWPHSMLRQQLANHAAEFLRQIATQGFLTNQSAEALPVWGPFTEKVGPMRPYTPEASNDFIPDHAKRSAERVWGYRGDELDWSRGCAFLIQGAFTRHSSYGTVDNVTGRMVV